MPRLRLPDIHITAMDARLPGSIGIATAPAGTFLLMNQRRIEGRLRHILGIIVVVDDLIEVIIFSLLVQLSLQRNAAGSATSMKVVVPVITEVLLALLVGGIIYRLLRLVVRRKALSLYSAAEENKESENEVCLHRSLAEHPSPSAEIRPLARGTVSLGAGLASSQQCRR